MKKILGRVPPVGQPIAHKRSEHPVRLAGCSQQVLVQSGTAALALALAAIRKARPCENPEVIIPAYCCPDLLSAIDQQGMKAVLVDFAPGSAQLDLDVLQAALNDNTIAVIAVNFLGLPERIGALRTALQGSNAYIVEDAAQWFPNDDSLPLDRGDIIIHSFGKGKPVSLLGGGIALVPAASSRSLALESENIGQPRDGTDLRGIVKRAIQTLKFHAYNLVLSPWFYWLVDVNPLVETGTTRYKQLAGIDSMSPEIASYLANNIEQYQAVPVSSCIETQQKIEALFKGSEVFQLLDGATEHRLLRFPVLVNDPEVRAELLALSKRLGLGISVMYAKTLPHIEGVDSAQLGGQDHPNAKRFAQQLITLPVHPQSISAIAPLIRHFLT